MDRSQTAAATPLARAERFIWLTARVLEQHRFAYHFLGGRAEAVETALAAYERDDGGYGYGLEPDRRGPVSQPLATALALRVLDEIDRCGGPRAERICRFLTAVARPDGALPALLPAQRGYPAAPWPPVRDHPPSELLSTGPVVGLLHRNGVWHAWLFRATDFCWAAVEALAEGARAHPDEVVAAVSFLDGAPDRPRAEALAERLGRWVREQRLLVLDPDRAAAYPVAEGYAPGARHFPHDVAREPGSLARRWFTDAEMKRSLDHLAAAQEADGGWPARRHAWAPCSGPGWRALATVEALLTLRAHGRAG
ncbi:hypothetical protein [Streptomyces pactum]|uniref:hypothetical protein n=1 Tax=Streptomyces pactum TaxID=68249 RepID=UPI0036F51B7E